MVGLVTWQAALLGLGLTVVALLLTIWWRQQSGSWPIVLLICLAAAPLLSWWSGQAFEVADYRAGCDGLCLGSVGAPIPFFQGQAAGGNFLPGSFLVNCLVFLALLLGWSAVMRAVLRNLRVGARDQLWWQVVGGLVMLIGPFLLSPLYLPPPQAHVRGDAQRIAINAQREIYLYDDQASAAILRASLVDVRPRPDTQVGMRVCLRLYTFFYLPSGFMYLDMTPEGVHSNHGGVLSLEKTCWD